MIAAKNNDIESYLTFKIGDELFAVNVIKIHSILELTRITKIPRTPKYIRGIINHHGAVLPIVDIRDKFDLEPTDLNSGACILALDIEMEGKLFKIGALVDSVDEVIELDSALILPAPHLGKTYRSDFIDGFYKTDTSVTMILNIDKLFSEDDITVIGHSELVLEEEEKQERI